MAEPNLTRSDADIKQAVKMWFDDKEAALMMYGNISDWDVSNVTNMEVLFAGPNKFKQDSPAGAKVFNDDISKWIVIAIDKKQNLTINMFKKINHCQDISKSYLLIPLSHVAQQMK